MKNTKKCENCSNMAKEINEVIETINNILATGNLPVGKSTIVDIKSKLIRIKDKYEVQI